MPMHHEIVVVLQLVNPDEDFKCPNVLNAGMKENMRGVYTS